MAGRLQGFTDTGFLRISESVRAYVYLILGSQASERSSIIGNMESALTVQRAFLNNFGIAEWIFKKTLKVTKKLLVKH